MNMNEEKPPIEQIKEDIRQGKEYEVLALKYETSIDYIKKVASEMRKDGEKIVDRRSKEWRSKQLILEEQLSDMFRGKKEEEDME